MRPTLRTHPFGARPLIALLATSALMLPACSGGGGDALVSYSGRSEELVGPLLARFSEETGTAVAPRLPR